MEYKIWKQKHSSPIIQMIHEIKNKFSLNQNEWKGYLLLKEQLSTKQQAQDIQNSLNAVEDILQVGFSPKVYLFYFSYEVTV